MSSGTFLFHILLDSLKCVRALYVEMLGQDASFAYIKAVELCASPNIVQKRVGYLACKKMESMVYLLYDPLQSPQLRYVSLQNMNSVSCSSIRFSVI